MLQHCVAFHYAEDVAHHAHRIRKDHATRARARRCLRVFALPTEVRAIILRELLYSPTPLGFKTEKESSMHGLLTARNSRSASRNFRLHLQILPTCKQLHQEGQPILLSNTFGVDAWLDDGKQVFWSFLGSQPRKETHFYWDRITTRYGNAWTATLKVRLALHRSSTDFEEDDWIVDDGNYAKMTHRVHEVYALLKKKENLRDCAVTIAISNIRDDYAPDENDRTRVFDALSMLRCKQAEVSGVSDTYAAEIGANLMSTKPAKNLYGMRDYFERYVLWYYQELPEGWEDILDSVLAADVDWFEELRAKMIEEIDEDREERVNEIFELDEEDGQLNTDQF